MFVHDESTAPAPAGHDVEEPVVEDILHFGVVINGDVVQWKLK